MKKYLKQTILILVTCLSVGCSSKIEADSYYLLPITDNAEQAKRDLSDKNIYVWVAPVKVNELLSGRGIVYQLNEVEYAIATQNLWAVPLQRQIQQQLADRLQSKLPLKLVTTQKMGEPSFEIYLKLDQFNGRYNGDAVVSGEWYIVHNGKEKAFSSVRYTKALDNDGYDALIMALSKCLDDLASEMVDVF